MKVPDEQTPPILKTGDKWELNIIDRMKEKLGLSFHLLRIVLSIAAFVEAGKLIYRYLG